MNKWLPAIVFSVLLLAPILIEDVYAAIAIPNLLDARKGANESPPQGEGMMPLGTNFEFVLSRITIETSSTNPSVGQSNYQFPGNPSDVANGQEFNVDSFFDVYYEITIEDIDPDKDFAVGIGSPLIFSTGPIRTTSSFTCVADRSEPNFGCQPQGSSLNPTDSIGFVDADGSGTLAAFDIEKMFLQSFMICSFNAKEGSGDLEQSCTIDMEKFDATVNPPFSIPMTGTITIKEDIFHIPTTPVIKGLVIDDFTQGPFSLTIENPSASCGAPPCEESQTNTGIDQTNTIGGSRTVKVEIQRDPEPPTTTQIQKLLNSVLFTSETGTTVKSTLTYDNDGAGLGGVDGTCGGECDRVFVLVPHEWGHVMSLGHSAGDFDSPPTCTTDELDEALMVAFSQGENRPAYEIPLDKFTSTEPEIDCSILQTKIERIIIFGEGIPSASITEIEEIFFGSVVSSVSGTQIPIDNASLLLAGTHLTASWLIPVIVSAVGIGLIFTKRK